jgi:hypothetical protein
VDSRRLTLLLGEVNDRIYDLHERGGHELQAEFLCECGRGCDRRVSLPPAAFEALRRRGAPVRSPECRDRKPRRPSRGRELRDSSVSAAL